jgi:hypothetical protein
LLSNGGKDEIALGTIPLKIWDEIAKPRHPGRAGLKATEDEPAVAHMQIGPVPLTMGAAAPANAAGWVSASGFRFSLRGDTDVKSLFRLATTLGISGFRPLAEGSARLDANLSGDWQGKAAPAVAGTAQLRNVRTGMRGLNPAINIASATIKLEPETVSLDKIDAHIGDTHWSGVVQSPRHCPSEGCVFQFDLNADQLSSAGLVEWFTPRPAKRPWYRILTSAEPPGTSALLAIRAQGRLRVNQLLFRKVTASQVVSQGNVDRGKITLTGLRAQLFQGTHQGDWIVDVSALPLHYQGAGTLQNVSMAQVSAAMNDAWATGTADGKFTLATSGDTFSDLLAHSEGKLEFTLRNGTLAHVILPDAGKAFPVHTLTGDLTIKAGTWKLGAGKLESHDGMYQLSGTASPGSGLNMQLTRGDDQSWNITGTLLNPSVARASRTEARTVIKP